jgi:hypothetical protein
MNAFRKNLALFRAHPAISALIIYQFFFFNIVLPLHTRGMITVDGKHTADTACCCCCGGGASKPVPGSEPSQKDKENCAICYFAAHVMPTPFPNLKLPELGLLRILPPPPSVSAVSLDLLLTYQSRGPPAVV